MGGRGGRVAGRWLGTATSSIQCVRQVCVIFLVLQQGRRPPVYFPSPLFQRHTPNAQESSTNKQSSRPKQGWPKARTSDERRTSQGSGLRGSPPCDSCCCIVLLGVRPGAGSSLVSLSLFEFEFERGPVRASSYGLWGGGGAIFSLVGAPCRCSASIIGLRLLVWRVL